jgi:hypothetical protein
MFPPYFPSLEHFFFERNTLGEAPYNASLEHLSGDSREAEKK